MQIDAGDVQSINSEALRINFAGDYRLTSPIDKALVRLQGEKDRLVNLIFGVRPYFRSLLNGLFDDAGACVELGMPNPLSHGR